ncbi:MAG: hypothetical protein O7G87_17635 [bacterium]|nr:hypothetical protein [bacterium]
MNTDPIPVVMKVVESLDVLDIPYLVGGSVASSYYGESRTTEDVDLVVDLGSKKIPKFVSAMQPVFYIDEVDVREAVDRRGSFNVIHLETMLKIDLFVTGDRPMDREEMRRRQLMVITDDPERNLYMATPEDVILQKLDWYRRVGGVSDRQWRDIMGVLKVQDDRLDLTYIRQWADRLGFSDLLSRALEESGH